MEDIYKDAICPCCESFNITRTIDNSSFFCVDCGEVWFDRCDKCNAEMFLIYREMLRHINT